MRVLALAVTAGTAVSAVMVLGDAGSAAASEVGRLDNSSEIFVLNATGLSVDVYVNYEAQPTVSDPKPLVGEFAAGDELTPNVFVVQGTVTRPYGAYTFSVRPKGDPTGPVIAAASTELEQGRSFSGVFHEGASGGYQFSIYENDLAPAAASRLTVRNTTTNTVAWRISPNGEAPDIPPDERSGTLAPGEWQTARDVVDNDYTIEFFDGGDRVAMFPDLDLAAHKTFAVYLIGDPQPTSDETLLGRPIAFQELEFDPGDPEPHLVTPAAPPASFSDSNAPIAFTCEPVSVWETNERSNRITAVDPDGFVTNLSVEMVDPPAGGVQIVDGSFAPSPALGEPATARVRFKGEIPDGIYEVWIAANRGSSGEQARCVIELTVRQITVQRLLNLLETYRSSGDVADDLAESLRLMLRSARQNMNDGNVAGACADVKRVLNTIGAEKGKAISDVAADDLSAETKALATDRACG